MGCAHRELRIAGTAIEKQPCKWTLEGEGKSDKLSIQDVCLRYKARNVEAFRSSGYFPK